MSRSQTRGVLLSVLHTHWWVDASQNSFSRQPPGQAFTKQIPSGQTTSVPHFPNVHVSPVGQYSMVLMRTSPLETMQRPHSTWLQDISHLYSIDSSPDAEVTMRGTHVRLTLHRVPLPPQPSSSPQRLGIRTHGVGVGPGARGSHSSVLSLHFVPSAHDPLQSRTPPQPSLSSPQLFIGINVPSWISNLRTHVSS